VNVAVIEPTDEMRAAASAYKMPNPKRGQQLLWYPHADKNEQPEVVFARKVGNRSVLIALGGGQCIETVPHLNDPRLGWNDDQRSSGAWDFPETEREIAALKEEVGKLKSRVEQLEGVFNEPAKPEVVTVSEPEEKPAKKGK
jgi:hypothetical protein